MKICFVLLLLTTCMAGSCQYKMISASNIETLKVNGFLVLKDSILKNYDNPIIEINTFYVTVKKALFNRKTKRLRLIGKACFDIQKLDCVGIPKLGVFKMQNQTDLSIKNWIRIAETSDKQEGDFDLTIEFDHNTSLLFYLPNFYIIEFQIGKLLDS